MPQIPQKRNDGEWWSSRDGRAKLWHGHVIASLRQLPRCSVQCIITSPPYWGLRADYDGIAKLEIGCEPLPDCGTWGKAQCGSCFVCNMVKVFREARGILRDDGVLWLNLGDTYAAGNNRNGIGGHLGGEAGRKPNVTKIVCTTGLPSGNLVGTPWRTALALQADGWLLRSDVPWVKRNALPDVCRRPGKSLEYWFLLAVDEQHYFQVGAAGKNLRNSDLWFQSIEKPFGLVIDDEEPVGVDATTRAYGDHFAAFPEALIEPLILSSSKPGSVVLDPFVGSGTTIVVALRHGRQGWGIDLSEKYLRENALPKINAELPREPAQPLTVGKYRLGG